MLNRWRFGLRSNIVILHADAPVYRIIPGGLRREWVPVIIVFDGGIL